MDAKLYRDTLREYQRAYASTLDAKTASLKLHEAALAAIRAASATSHPWRRARHEHRALRILNALSRWLRSAARHPDADTALCDVLRIAYAKASLHLCRGEHEAAEGWIDRILR